MKPIYRADIQDKYHLAGIKKDFESAYRQEAEQDFIICPDDTDAWNEYKIWLTPAEMMVIAKRAG